MLRVKKSVLVRLLIRIRSERNESSIKMLTVWISNRLEKNLKLNSGLVRSHPYLLERIFIKVILKFSYFERKRSELEMWIRQRVFIQWLKILMFNASEKYWFYSSCSVSVFNFTLSWSLRKTAQIKKTNFKRTQPINIFFAKRRIYYSKKSTIK